MDPVMSTTQPRVSPKTGGNINQQREVEPAKSSSKTEAALSTNSQPEIQRQFQDGCSNLQPGWSADARLPEIFDWNQSLGWVHRVR